MSETAGWDAIDAHLRGVFGPGEPTRHWGTVMRWADGGPDPLDGISMYDCGDHWHYVGLGLSELGPKTSDLPKQSGWGIELTLRLQKAPGEAEGPSWPLKRLNQLARYVFESRNVLLPGDFMDTNGPLSATVPTSAIRALLFALDPTLGELDGPNGKVRFVQLVGVTKDELAAAQSWNTGKLLGVLKAASPRWVTDLGRESWLVTRPELAAEARAGAEREGSSHGASFTKQLKIESGWLGGTTIEIGALAIPDFTRGLRYRVPFGQPFFLDGPSRLRLKLVPATASAWDASACQLSLTARDARAIADALPQKRGEHAAGIVKGVTFRIVPTEIEGSQGEIVEVLG